MYNIEKLIGKPAVLEQLAEEAAELAKAALKLSRILRDENPTPVSKEDACINLVEEFTDVVHCARELRLQVDEVQVMSKDERWNNRLKAQIK